ncbi:hypothetical protein FJTKL_13629 [Diaporthe vaccinii]|uniref:Uncharacterized protein n=1 Tax=Diaporthe vaccinii TaxID=105482 RepID=A0ABR4EA34_9PEZI
MCNRDREAHLKLSVVQTPEACVFPASYIATRSCHYSQGPYRSSTGRKQVSCVVISPRCILLSVIGAPLIHGDAQLPQLPLGDLDLAHELVVRLGDVVEGQDAPAEADEQVGAEGDEGPEGQDGDDLGLDDGGEGDQVEVEGEVGLFLLY